MFRQSRESAVPLGYGVLTITVVGVAARLLLGERLPRIEWRIDALMCVFSLFGIGIGRKLRRLEESTDRLESHGFWAAVIRMHAYKLALPLGYVLLACGGVGFVANLVFDQMPSENRLLMRTAGVFIALLGAFIIYFGRALRRVDDRIKVNEGR